MNQNDFYILPRIQPPITGYTSPQCVPYQSDPFVKYSWEAIISCPTQTIHPLYSQEQLEALKPVEWKLSWWDKLILKIQNLYDRIGIALQRRNGN